MSQEIACEFTAPLLTVPPAGLSKFQRLTPKAGSEWAHQGQDGIHHYEQRS